MHGYCNKTSREEEKIKKLYCFERWLKLYGFYCASRLNLTPAFAVYSLMVILIETEISEMNLDIDHAFGLFFSLKYDLLYRLGLDGISACFCSSTLN